MRRKSLSIFLACAALFAQSGGGKHKSKNQKVGEPGQFDFYVLSLSWSPAFCQSKPNDPQCAPGRKFAFVLHGLWPQYNTGKWPQFCTTDAGLKNPDSMLDIMPSKSLISHEWSKHGTCSGMNADGYFGTARKAYDSVKVPKKFQAPDAFQTISAAEVKQEFLTANSGWKAENVAITCSSNFLSEVRVCLDKNLKPVSCGKVQECKAPSLRVPPVR